ncbi:MAG TPA: DEAD/DEAH box helicase [Polyangiaceae bacterium]
MKSDASELARLDLEHLPRAAGFRSFNLALASPLIYRAGPVLSDHVLRAVFGPASSTRDEPRHEFGVALYLDDQAGDALVGDCSRCQQVFGPCPHLALLALDLALSAPLREALLAGRSPAEAAFDAPERRAVLHAERQFDRALSAWIAPAVASRPVQISASPFPEDYGQLHRSYGDFTAGAEGPTLALQVRNAGERKHLAPRDVLPPSRFAPRDRRVLEHSRDRGSGRKATYATGVEASLAIEAMRAHGSVYAHGYKAILDFRSGVVRPTLTLGDRAPTPGSPSSALETLSAVWTSDDGAVLVAFDDAVFFAGPFPYVWTRGGPIYRVAADVDADFVRQLVSAPVLRVPVAKLRDTGARLLRATRGRGVVMPVHEAFGLPRVEIPRLVLRMVGEPLDFAGELVAVYPKKEVPLVGAGATFAEPAAGADDASDDGRDFECEARARAHLERVGLLQRGELGGGLDVEDPADPEFGVAPERIAVSGEPAVAFWQTGLLSLRDASDPPIEVQLTERLARVRVGAPLTGRVQVALEGDWLQARLEFASAELPVELSAIRVALRRSQRWVALSDGTLARISASIEALADEAGVVMADRQQAKLPAHQLGRLDRWIEENDGRVDEAVEGLRRRLRALAVAAEPDMPKNLRATLRPYQRLGVAWLQFLQALGAGGILADDMGLGKTIMTLAFLLRRKQAEGRAPNLVVCPTSVASNWLREAARFTPGLRVLLLHGPSRDPTAIGKCDVVVTTYALLRRDIETLSAIPFRCVVLDEAQNIKNSDSATTRAANRLDATMRIALSGTPVENRLRELWSLSNFVNPGILGTVRSFETRFERPIVADRTSPLAAELRAIVRPFLLRRTKDDVLRDLPPKIEVDRVVTLSEADKRMYDALAHTLRGSIARDIENRGLEHISLSVFTALTRLRQMACDPRLVDPALGATGTAGDGPAVGAKRGAFLDLVRELVAEGRRALVFSQFVQLLTLWRRDLDAEQIAYEYLDGSTTHREVVVDRFQKGTAPLFLISLKAGGAGLNLTAADTVIHCDPWWNPAVEDQATDRTHRIGQEKTVTVVRLIAHGTIEEKILSLKAKKRELSRVVIGSDARALEGLTEADIRVLLGNASDGDGEVERDDGAWAEGDEPGQPAQVPRPLDDALATSSRVLSPEFAILVAEAQRFLMTSGMPKARLAALAEIPAPYVSRLARGEPFPCSRAVADRIRRKIAGY